MAEGQGFRRMQMSFLLVALLLSLSGATQVVETGPPMSDIDSPGIPEAIDVLPALLAEAESTIDIAQMYMLYYPPWSRGAVLHRLYDGIAAAAERGVTVRILVDASVLEANPGMTYGRIPSLLAELPGVEVRSCDLRPYSNYSDCMMHAKYLVVDDRAAFLGSHNWSYGAMTDNRELSVLAQDTSLARALAAIFSQDWNAAGGFLESAVLGNPDTRLAVTAPAGLVYSGPTILKTLVQLAASATRSLDLEVNSLSTRVDFGTQGRFGFVDSVLRETANRGVCVRLLIDHRAFDHDPGLFHGLDSLPGIEVRVADIRRAGPNPDAGTVHSKLIITDGREAMLGSATLSQRQLLECRNVAVRLVEQEAVAQLTEFFEAGWRSSFVRPVTAVRPPE